MFVCDIDGAGLAELAEELPRLATGLCDVSRREQIERMVAEAAQALGGIDVLINNAGIAGPTAPTAELDPDAWEKVLQVDLKDLGISWDGEVRRKRPSPCIRWR
ncbi:hypothetical protein MAE02_14340 [Microvirga aerophila]|uniref:Uncharacterized protein n=1 Tax=Microvirga aerophila TaxID=670291 RepID=A0A512BP53_9HYPH|nr:hypothetical protein MAE02_14340 [Microvirga aerophila]